MTIRRSRATRGTTAPCPAGWTHTSSRAVSSCRDCESSTFATRSTREIAYFNKPTVPGTNFYPFKAGAFAMSAPAYDEETGDIWYTDGNSGFYVVRLTEAAGIDRFARKIVYPGN